ncbi:MAG: hypothetical protein LBL18_04075 [Bacteroidales bacterium]|jgi:hypothetical protein|nr:hypothetical protein [Bacteroidales bacterium]
MRYLSYHPHVKICIFHFFALDRLITNSFCYGRDRRRKKEEVTEQPLKGRAAWIDRYKKANPETGEEIEDEDLFEYANGGYSDIEGKYNQLNGANSRLAELVAGDPKLGAALSMVA